MSNSSWLPNRALTKSDTILDRHGRSWPLLCDLDAEELSLVNQLVNRFKSRPPRHEFRNAWMQLMASYADRRGIERSAVIHNALYQIGADLDARLLVEQGLARPADYRDELESLIATGFPTRRSFCEATGLSEDMLSHVLAKRKNLAIDTLAEALDKIGYAIHILPQPEIGIR